MKYTSENEGISLHACIKSLLKKWKYNYHQPIPICEMDSSSLCDVAFAMASGSSREKGKTSLKHRQDVVISAEMKLRAAEERRKV